MSKQVPNPRWKKLEGAILAVLILSVIAMGFLGTALALGTEPRLVVERTGPGTFRVTGSSCFAGYPWFSKTIEGVTGVVAGSAVRDRRSDSQRERQRRSRQKHLDIYGVDGRRVGWDREEDQALIERYMRGSGARLALSDPPQRWRMGVAWFCAIFGVLILVGAVQSNFFPKSKPPSGLP